MPYKRVRVQARQIFVFSCAHGLGWPGALEAASDGYEFLTRHARRADGGWVRLLGRDGEVLDPTADLYDLAFVVFALAWYARATGSAEAIGQAHDTLAWIGGQHGEPGRRLSSRPCRSRRNRGGRIRTCICWKPCSRCS